MKDIKEEFKMENKKDYEIKMDGKEHKFGDATRYTKEGKGRFDLIPEDVITNLIAEFDEAFVYGDIHREPRMLMYAMESAYNELYHEAIMYMVMYHYCEDIEMISFDDIISKALPEMLQDLAVHFQKGAEKYGERNCEKGIPLWSFRDSGLRHLGQWLMGNRDENHFIAAIWNFVMALWTIDHHPERCGDKPESTETVNDNSNDKKEVVKDKYDADAINPFKNDINEIRNIFGAIFGE